MTEIITSINPATNEYLGEVPVSTPQDIQDAVQSARTAQPAWQAMGLEKRVVFLRKLLEQIKNNRKTLSEISSREMGRPITSCEALMNVSIDRFAWNLDHAAECLKSEITYEDETTINEVVYEPRGVVASIMAWNFPIGNFVFNVSQALIAGNTVVAKYSEEIPLFSKHLDEICKGANLPEGVLSFVYGDGKVGSLLTDQDIDMICFTGSSQTGQLLHEKAARKGIHILMELGGSSPGIVFADANLDKILPTIFALRYGNSGQVCSAIKRLIVHSSLFETCLSRLAKIAAGWKLGDPLSSDVAMGPLVAERQVTRLETQVKDAVAKGAKIICGGKRPEGLHGAYYEPTILTGITKDMLVWTEEVFGPVLPIITFETYEEAIAMANDTVYGLSGYVFTEDKALALRATSEIKAGCVRANNVDYFKIPSPFGGYKRSGIGRENGRWGFHDVCQVKVIAREK